MSKETLIFAGQQHEAYAFARDAKIAQYTVVSESYHVRTKERGSTLVLVGTWSNHSSIKKVEEEARRRGMPIMTSEQFIKRGKAP